MSIDPTDIRMRGGVPLESSAAGPAPAAAGQAPGGGFVIDVTEATFQSEVIDRSRTVPVVIDFWAEWCGPCKQLSPTLERLAAEGGGSWVLAKVDADANPRLTQAFGVQSIPSVKAVVGGQLVELFTGALPEAQVRQVLDQLRSVAAQMGVVGRAEPVTPVAADGAEPEPPAYVVEAEAAIAKGDMAAAAAAFEKALADNPSDALARQGLAQVRFVERLQAIPDPEQARRAAADQPDDIEAQIRAADVDLYGNQADEAFDRLVGLVRRTAGDERDRVRRHLLDLFDMVGPDDPSVLRARRALTSALF